TLRLRSPLQILVHPSSHAIQRLLDVLDRVRHAEAQIAFSETTEGSAGQRGNACLVEECVGQFLRWPSSLRDVRENVERTMRRAAGETLDFVKATDHHIAPFLKLRSHRINGFLRSAQRF